MASPSTLRVALLGCGVVGTQVVRLLKEQDADLSARVGAKLELIGIAVRDKSVTRDPIVDPALLTEDAYGLIENADLVVEVMGGIDPARSLILHAFEHGASVVTANKALLAKRGTELYEAAQLKGVDIIYEAAVAGAIPIIRQMRESLVGDRIERVLGIVNGTTNYILDQMTVADLDFETALKQAQDLGYAEADPTADVEGHDAAAKAAILASLAFHTRVHLDDVSCQGITEVSFEDVKWAKNSGYVIKLLAICELTEQGISARVHPTLVPNSHPLSGVHGAFNAVFVQAKEAGELMFYGQGAGGAPTASAVVGDLASLARNRVLGGRSPIESAYAKLDFAPFDSAQTRYQIRLQVLDQPGVLAAVSGVFGQHSVSIETVRQIPKIKSLNAEGKESELAQLIITTHKATEAALARIVAEVAELEVVPAIKSVLRVEGA